VLKDLDAGGVAVQLGHQFRNLSPILFVLSKETVHLRRGMDGRVSGAEVRLGSDR
jgi:hypothetical protein